MPIFCELIQFYCGKKNRVLNSELFYVIKMISRKEGKKVCGSLMPEIDPKHFMKKDIHIQIEKWKIGEEKWK